MTLIEAIVIGIIQGLTEFLPVSSSGHLAVINHLFTKLDSSANLTLIVLVHFATMFSVIICFRREILQCIKQDFIVLAFLVAASIPAAIAGFMYEDYFEKFAGNMLIIGLAFMASSLLLLLAHYQEGEQDDLKRVGFGRALTIGCFQILGMMPGISRSGSSLAGSMFCGLNRNSAVTFAFLMSIPVVGGAALLKLPDVPKLASKLGPDILIAAFISALLSGMAAIWLVKWVVNTNKLYLFSVYLFLVSILTLNFHFEWITV
ncbi:undecaprenyl-diphosphate phosphatase [Planctomycetota bacterium]